MYFLPLSLFGSNGESDFGLSFVLALFGECENALMKCVNPFVSRLILLLTDEFELEWSRFCPDHKGSRQISTFVASLVRVEDLFHSGRWPESFSLPFDVSLASGFVVLPSGVSLEDLLFYRLALA